MAYLHYRLEQCPTDQALLLAAHSLQAKQRPQPVAQLLQTKQHMQPIADENAGARVLPLQVCLLDVYSCFCTQPWPALLLCHQLNGSFNWQCGVVPQACSSYDDPKQGLCSEAVSSALTSVGHLSCEKTRFPSKYRHWSALCSAGTQPPNRGFAPRSNKSFVLEMLATWVVEPQKPIGTIQTTKSKLCGDADSYDDPKQGLAPPLGPFRYLPLEP